MRYRIRYVVDPFEHDIEADNIKEAERVADELTTGRALLDNIECRWNTIEPLEE